MLYYQQYLEMSIILEGKNNSCNAENNCSKCLCLHSQFFGYLHGLRKLMFLSPYADIANNT